jgi:hypothetical protein
MAELSNRPLRCQVGSQARDSHVCGVDGMQVDVKLDGIAISSRVHVVRDRGRVEKGIWKGRERSKRG